MLNYHTKAEIDEIERVYLAAERTNDWCCADQGICHHDANCVRELRKILKKNGGKSNGEIRAMGKIPKDDLWLVWP